MLVHLHVKNLALIQEVQADFGPGLNILTGETGAGKSILMGSVNLALGQKMSRGMIREGAPYALVELVFQVDSCTEEKLKELDVFPEEGQVIITRKLMENRSISKVNGEASTAGNIKKIAALLLDIHGQHEHQSLLYPEKQMEILDEFGGGEILEKKEGVKGFYIEYSRLKKELESYQIDEEQRRREMGFLEYEIQEISQAQLKPGEDQELETVYRKLANGKKITEGLGSVYQITGYEGEGMGAQMGRAMQKISQIREYDSELENIYSSMEDMDSLLNDLNRELSSYLSEFVFSDEEFQETENRLDLINHLKSKYGHTIEEILSYQGEKEKELERLENFQARKKDLERRLEEQEMLLKKASQELTRCRKDWASMLEEKIIQSLQDLNFLNVEFHISFREKESYTAQGKDSITFMISTNPGEPVLPLQQVVSGGELSRIMLAIKTLLADKDQTETLIFDEIDTGISGRTAQKVAEKMKVIGENHQVLCITHLPQIASQADYHYLIEKNVENMETSTRIRRLSYDDSVEELARMLGGAKITDAVLQNAAEMKDLAQQQKNTRLK
ncbi:DNA repair protein RecN [Blautia sp. An46]|uniref:DNA repair protein RecN n=1 Tax=Blautia sp. An46 TaxID=1965636 RepID=UPI000B39AC05|nr:DNA repair protein RecN [Blautia sp. An46]OUN95078.1 DNA repair protein RecN [Blautia sp. An46]HJD36912.1 DNA repair protein RecN [Candidatus Blautia ornithocaccae]